ncbi:uncharacterized protein [Rutidosis leptorrhynchoides]|uniref:uncharacterized protein n=1 Tax=Rutidosis leptorrhynchoides TaxID=125765 RepID=UPI003A995778
MAKRSKRRQAKQKKDETGCMSGLISMFDFRHGRSATRNLLTDRRIVNNNTVASEYIKVDSLTSSEDRHVCIEDITECEKPILDNVKTSVMKLMEEEMVGEQDSTKHTNGDEAPKTAKKSSDDHVTSISQHVSSQKTSHFSDTESLMKEILLIYQRKIDHDHDHDVDEDQNHTFSIVEEKLTAAVEAFVNEKSDDEHSKDFIETVQILSSNKELFMKLLLDQASEYPNEDHKSRSKSKSKSNPLEKETDDPKPYTPVTRKHKNFFRRKSKSEGNIPLSRIVILKPNSPNNNIFKMEENDVHNEKTSSHFSFMEIKKRLKNAMGKEQPKRGVNEKKVDEGSNGWSSPNRDHFYTERFAKRIERGSKLKDSEIKQSENEENGNSSHHISNIYIEAKKHLSEMLSGGDDDDDDDMIMENLPKTLGKILSYPQYESQPCVTSDDVQENYHAISETQPCVASDDVKEIPKVPDECRGASSSSMAENTSPEGIIEVETPENQEEMEVSEVCNQPCSSPESRDDAAIINVSNEERSPPTCFKTDILEENEFSSPMGSAIVNKIEDELESDKTGRPSPVSVLDPLFSDNEISPASTTSRCVEYAIQPLRIQFEDQDIRSRNCMENEESAFEYVEAMLLASDLNWDEFENRWLSSVQIIDSSLFDELQIFSSQPSYDQRLLFDSTNEILKELCDCYIELFLRLSFTKHKIQPVPKGVDLINEVWERIEQCLKSNYPLSLDHLVKKDLEISRTWMDLRFDSSELLFEIDESIFEDMIDDILLSLLIECVDYER